MQRVELVEFNIDSTTADCHKHICHNLKINLSHIVVAILKNLTGQKILYTIIKMEISKGFYDLCVPYQSNENDMIAILNELYEGNFIAHSKFRIQN